MEQYYFLFGLGLAWLVFAVVQDLRTREIANWLNFSLIAFALSYRAFYSAQINDWMFFVYGLGGVLLFVVLGYAFYSAGVFAGGDAKLLFGLGAILPYETIIDYATNGLGFIVLLFIGGVVYTLIYTVFLAGRNFRKFKKDFNYWFKKRWILFVIAVFLAFALTVFSLYSGYREISFLFLIIIILPFLYAYSKAVESSCMVKLISARKLTEGDWLERDVRVGNKTIKKTAQGLTAEEIKVLKRHGKKVWIKEGVPFTPAFLIAYLFFAWRIL